MKTIYILHENNEWVTPLKASFAQLGIEPQEWFLNEGEVNFDELPPDGVFYNRMSASSHTRGHRYAPELTHVVLNWLESHRKTVINGTKALYLEVSKIAQYAGLKAVDIKVPKTLAVVGKDNLINSAEQFGYPLILKPNRGGKGLGVQLFREKSGLEKFLQSDEFETPLDGIWLIQQYIEASEPYIVRCEFVGGRFLYAVKVATDEGFELCPADICQIGDDFCPVSQAPQTNKFSITDELNNDAFIKQAECFLNQNRIGIAGIEVIRDKQGQLYAYDVNTNTNYNAPAEIEAGLELSGMDAIAKYLSTLATCENATKS